MKVDLTVVKKLREETGAPIMRAKQVLEECQGNQQKALEILRKEGFERAEKRQDRATQEGYIAGYVHHSGKVASLVELLCETDFVARNELFREAAHNIALQVASMAPRDVKELEEQPFVKDPNKKVGDLVKELIAKTGENIKVGKITRIELGKD